MSFFLLTLHCSVSWSIGVEKRESLSEGVYDEPIWGTSDAISCSWLELVIAVNIQEK
jgi:hypothetical protein